MNAAFTREPLSADGACEPPASAAGNSPKLAFASRHSVPPDRALRLAIVTHYVDSEVGRLGTVMLHRPGPELARLTPRNNDSLLFDGIPWVGRAQEEHDAFAAALRDRGRRGALPRPTCSPRCSPCPPPGPS